MMQTLLICFMLHAPPDANEGSGQIKSSALVTLAETARMNRSSCGPLAVSYVLRRLGFHTDSEELMAAADLDENGTSIRHLLELLSERDCPGRAICTQTNRLTLLPAPSILIVDKGTHCVVFDGLDNKSQAAKVFETTSKEVRFVDVSKLRKEWTGEAIIFDRPRLSPFAFSVVCLSTTAVIFAMVVFLISRCGPIRRSDRTGFTLIELLVALGIVGLLFAILLPVVQQMRESSRATHCRNNMRQIGVALQNYEGHFRVFPPAVIWEPAGEPLGQSIAAPGTVDRVSLGLASALQPDRIHANWAIALLPFLGEDDLYHSFDLTLPLGDAANSAARAAELGVMICPSDAANAMDNHFQRSGLSSVDQGYARGNYAINGGTNRRCLMRLSRRKLNCVDGVLVNGTDLQRDTSQVWGNGVAGLNRSMRTADFSSGLSKLATIEEIRAGIHPLDRRGVWSLGYPGSSITACHGLYGNNGPNIGKDAIQGCSETIAHVHDLEQQGMPCLQSKADSRLELSERATARSMHIGGVNLLMADGSAHFVADSIDKQVWHNLHKRDNNASAGM